MRIIVAALVVSLAGCATIDRVPPRKPLPDLDNPWYESAQDRLSATIRVSGRTAQARNVILFIGDGMSISTVTAARILAGQLAGATGEENLLAFERFPHVAFSKTYNTNAQVPDSAGTATAMLSGVKTRIGVLGVDETVQTGECASAAASSVPTLLEHAENAGMATGVVTTTRITHATPAAAYAHAASRQWEMLPPGDCMDIATQLVNFGHGDGPEVVLGGGRSMFMGLEAVDPEYPDKRGLREDGRDLLAEWQQRYGDKAAYVWNRQQFNTVDIATTDHLLGLFEPSHMQYEADRDPAAEPSLAEMVTTAVSMLQKSNSGFFLLVEGGRIDHAHHSANAYRALHDTIAMSDAVAAARRMTASNDTLIVVTADHGHVMEVAGYPYRGNPILGKVVGIQPDGSRAEDYSRDSGGKPYTTLVYGNGPGHIAATDKQPAGSKQYPHFSTRADEAAYSRPDLTETDTGNKDYLQESAIPMGSETHSGTDVGIYADGPGAWLFQGVHEQNYIFHVMAHVLFGSK